MYAKLKVFMRQYKQGRKTKKEVVDLIKRDIAVLERSLEREKVGYFTHGIVKKERIEKVSKKLRAAQDALDLLNM